MSEQKPLCKLCRERHWMREPHGKVTASESPVTEKERPVTDDRRRRWDREHKDQMRAWRKEYMRQYRALDAPLVQPKPQEPVREQPVVDAVSPSISREGYGKASSTVKPKIPLVMDRLFDASLAQPQPSVMIETTEVGQPIPEVG